MINHGKILEDKLAKALDDLGIPYTREGSKRSYGTRHSNKGKFDFMINNKLAIECKSINRAIDLSLPWPCKKSTKIRAHQLKALREDAEKGNTAGLLIEVREVEKMYWLNILDLDKIVQNHGMIPSLGIYHLKLYARQVDDIEGFLREVLG